MSVATAGAGRTVPEAASVFSEALDGVVPGRPVGVVTAASTALMLFIYSFFFFLLREVWSVQNTKIKGGRKRKRERKKITKSANH